LAAAVRDWFAQARIEDEADWRWVRQTSKRGTHSASDEPFVISVPLRIDFAMTLWAGGGQLTSARLQTIWYAFRPKSVAIPRARETATNGRALTAAQELLSLKWWSAERTWKSPSSFEDGAPNDFATNVLQLPFGKWLHRAWPIIGFQPSAVNTTCFSISFDLCAASMPKTLWCQHGCPRAAHRSNATPQVTSKLQLC